MTNQEIEYVLKAIKVLDGVSIYRLSELLERYIHCALHKIVSEQYNHENITYITGQDITLSYEEIL